MNLKSQPQQDQSNNEPAKSEVQYKQCNDCCAKLPLSHFTLNYLGKSGRNNVCKDCRAQNFRLLRKRKYNAKSKVDDSIIRSMLVQNTNILKESIFQPRTIDICGFIPSTQATFHIQFGRNRYDLESMAVYDDKGNSYFEVVYSGVDPDKVISQLLANLKEHNIRLERSEGDIVLAKRVVYYL